MQTTMRATHLTCEYHTDPLGIDAREPRFSWWVADERQGVGSTAYEIEVRRQRSDPGDPPLWASGIVEDPGGVFVPYRGAPLESCTAYRWRVRVRDRSGFWSDWSREATFETAFLDESEWQASWIAPSDVSEEKRGPAPLFTREFAIDAPVRTGRAYVSAKGLYVLSINGRRVGRDALAPGWTDYDRRCQYITYDVGSYLRPGRNVVAAEVGDGWFCGRISVREGDGTPVYGFRPELLLELHVVDERGGKTVVSTDDEWEWRDGPVRSSDIYDGERYDAEAEIPGWDTIDAPADGRSRVVVRGPAVPKSNPQAHTSSGGPSWSDGRPVLLDTQSFHLDAKCVPPIRPVSELFPVAVTSPDEGVSIYDLGQNMVGWARIAMKGTPGTEVRIRYAEMLQSDGRIYVENLRSAEATDTYRFASSSDGQVIWEPRFTFHGFRYIEVSGAPSAPTVDRLTGVVLVSDLREIGSFATSHEKLNRLAQNIVWGQRGNYLDAPTDCPQRDERLGWTGDAQVFVATAAFNMDVAPFFRKWMRDVRDAQAPSGTVPPFAPVVRYQTRDDEADGGPAWSDAMVICPWTIYRRYGDLRILEENYDAMKAFVRSLESKSRGLIRADESRVGWGGFGDWVSMDAPAGSPFGATPKEVVGTAYLAYSASLLAEIAKLLGKDEDEADLRDLHRRTVAAFRDEFVTARGRVVGDTQTAYSLALAFDLLPLEHVAPAVDRLVSKLRRRGYRLETGFVGTPLLCPVLDRYGHGDVAYRLLMQEEFPSWLYTVNQGATTMWERWNSYTIEDGFGPVSMNSFNHYAYGSIGEWMYGRVGGIDVDMTGPARGEPALQFRPLPGGGLSRATARLETPFGVASVSWERVFRQITVEIAVPPGDGALVRLPSAGAAVAVAAVDAGGDDVAGESDPSVASLVTPMAAEPDSTAFRVASGRYRFVWAPSDSEAEATPAVAPGGTA